MKKISFLLVLLILFQSCSIYHAPTSAEKAVAADKKVKIVTTDNKKYKFNRLEQKDDGLFGIVKRNSSTAKKLAQMPGITEGNFRVIDLAQMNIEKIQVRDKTGSVLITVAITVVAVLAALAALAVAALASLY